MVGYQKADRKAAAELVERVSPMLLRFLAGPLQTRAYAEDMLQECWLRIHRSRHTYRPGTPLLPWLFAIARYTRIDAYRRRRQIDANELAVEDMGVSAAGSPAIPDPVEMDLWRLVEELPPSQQEVIQMLKISGLSLDEVARATGSTVGAVKQKAHRAYQRLRDLLNSNAARKGE
jgi:RNA polymerase sigma-70 factor (ECF subfamily)